MANHLIIGLGGTGGGILKAFQKRLKAEFGNQEPANTHLDFIYVDSSEADLAASSLENNQKVNIHGMGGNVLANLAQYPSMKAFISDEDRAALSQDDQVGMIINTGIGGQRRRFGRMLIANNVMTDKVNGFCAVLHNRIHAMTNMGGEQGNFTIHICAGLAGGTGSGSIVDTIAQVNKEIGPLGAACDVYLYLFVPEIIVEADHDAGYYHANGYAALREINALALGLYHPTDITGEMDYTTGKIKRLLAGPNDKAFKQAYLFTNRNQRDYILPKGTLLPGAVADFLYQRIVANEVSNDPAMSTKLNRVINCENDPGAAEQNDAGENVHSRSFMSFGITRVVYPEAKIKTYATECSGISALIGLIYNRWVNTQGFQAMSDETAGVGIEAEIKLPSTQEYFRLSLPYITLQTPVAGFPGADNWSDFTSYWDNICTSYYDMVLQSQKDRHRWASDFDQYCTMEFTENFRSEGVGSFFNTWKQGGNVNNYAAMVMRHIETCLFREWVNGKHHLKEDYNMSLQKVMLYVHELRNHVIARTTETAQIKANAQADAKNGFIEADKHRMKLEDTGFISHLLFNAAKQEFNQYKSWMAKYYWSSCLVEACDFAALLLEEVSRRLAALEISLRKLMKLFHSTNELLGQKTSTFGTVTNNGQEVQVEIAQFNKELVTKTIEEKIVVDDDTQIGIAQTLREQMRTLVERHGSEYPFQSLFELLKCNDDILTVDQLKDAGKKAQKLDGLTKRLREIMESTIKPVIDQRLIQIGEQDASAKLLNVNILDKLYQDYPSTEMLQQYLATLAAKTECFLKTNGAEMGLGNLQYQESFQIAVPKHAKRDEFIETFWKACTGGSFTPESAAFNDRSNEIVIIRVASKILLRYSQNVVHMKEKYNSLTSEHHPKHRLNRVLLHTESLSNEQMPDLYQESLEAIQARLMRTAILIHSVEGLCQPGVDPATGNPISIIQVGDIFSGGQIYTIGADVTLTLQKLVDDYNFRQGLVKYVNQFVAANYKSDAQKQKLLENIKAMITRVILPKANNNILDPLFKQYSEAVQAIIRSL